MMLNKLTDDIKKWGHDRKIIQNGKPMGQAIKCLEECTELLDSINRDNDEDIADAIGDIYVTLVMVAGTSNLSIGECIEKVYNQIKERKDKKDETPNNGIEVGTIDNGKIFTNGIDVETLGRLYALLSSTTKETQGTQETKPKPGDDYQGGIYVGEFEGKHYVASKDERKLEGLEAKGWCANYSSDKYYDWFLPSKEELNFLYESKVIEGPSNVYWSSTEHEPAGAWIQHFSGLNAGIQSCGMMTYLYYVRAVRTVR